MFDSLSGQFQILKEKEFYEPTLGGNWRSCFGIAQCGCRARPGVNLGRQRTRPAVPRKHQERDRGRNARIIRGAVEFQSGARPLVGRGSYGTYRGGGGFDTWNDYRKEYEGRPAGTGTRR